MRFLCVSDMIDPLVYSTDLKERYGDADAVLCAGDVPLDYVDFITDMLGCPAFFVFGNHNLNEYERYRRRAIPEPRVGPPVVKEPRGHAADYAGGRVIREHRLSFRLPNGKKTPLLVSGVSGSRRYNDGEAQFTERQMRLKLLSLVPGLLWNRIRYGRYCDVFLTHAPPRHVHDREDPCHRGFECFNWFIKKVSPALLVHGHIHLYDLNDRRVTQCGKTTVVNAFGHIVLDLNLRFEKGEYVGSKIDILANR